MGPTPQVTSRAIQRVPLARNQYVTLSRNIVPRPRAALSPHAPAQLSALSVRTFITHKLAKYNHKYSARRAARATRKRIDWLRSTAVHVTLTHRSGGKWPLPCPHHTCSRLPSPYLGCAWLADAAAHATHNSPPRPPATPPATPSPRSVSFAAALTEHEPSHKLQIMSYLAHRWRQSLAARPSSPPPHGQHVDTMAKHVASHTPVVQHSLASAAGAATETQRCRLLRPNTSLASSSRASVPRCLVLAEPARV